MIQAEKQTGCETLPTTSEEVTALLSVFNRYYLPIERVEQSEHLKCTARLARFQVSPDVANTFGMDQQARAWIITGLDKKTTVVMKSLNLFKRDCHGFYFGSEDGPGSELVIEYAPTKRPLKNGLYYNTRSFVEGNDCAPVIIDGELKNSLLATLQHNAVGR